jgi:hypothetical protein
MNPTDSSISKAVPTLPQDAYRDERKLLIDEEREAARTFDKAMLTLSGGALGLSITFIRQLAPRPSATWLLIIAWLGLAIALLSTCIALHVSQLAFRRARDLLDDDQRGVKGALELRNSPAVWTHRLNWAATITFVLGICLLAAFAFVNLTNSGGTNG